ncbi:MAG: Ig-like domain-containing protein [Phycisphaerae bacterium]|nr:Ig-like domain-containing protein [Phycisphaerae bacterium]
MSRRWLVVVLGWGVTSATAVGAGTAPEHKSAHVGGTALEQGHQWSHMSGAALEQWYAAQPRDERAADTDVRHYHLDLTIDAAGHWLGGSNTMTVRSLVAGLSVFRFRLHDVLTISDLRVGGVPVTWTRLDEANIDVTLDRPYGAGEEFALYVAYSGYPQSVGSFGSITFRLRGGVPEAFTESDPWYAYTWWPAKDDLLDKTTADLWFTVPATQKVASNGVLLGVDDVGGGLQRYRWKTEYPTEDYLYCFATTNFDVFEDTWTYDGASMPLQFFIYPEHNTAGNRAAWLRCKTMLTTYSDVFGTYPFANEKYGMLEWGGAGAMEHQTMTSMLGFDEGTVAHELAHQWWGDWVTYATWHDIWLSEGFATYSEALWREFQPGSPGAPWLHANMANKRPSEPSGSVYVYNPDSIEAIFAYNTTYLKAAWVLHMLRHVVGDAAFFDLLAAYRAAYGGENAATTEDFVALAESATGRELSWYFDQWIYGVGAPFYVYAWRPLDIDGAGYVELFIEQLQGTQESVFTMPLDIVATDDNGPVTHVIWNDARREYLLLPVASPGVYDVAFDPTPWVLRAGQSEVIFDEGPPKIVVLDPPPGAVRTPAEVAAIELVFQEDIVADAGAFALVGARGGVVPCALAYDAARFAITLTPAAALATDTYTLTVADTLVNVATGQALDGELVKTDGSAPLPSGDGVPGGAAVATFTVTVRGDLNCDGDVDYSDINPFVLYLSNFAAWQPTYPGCPAANGDIDGNGVYPSFGDINPFVTLLTP